MGLCILILHFYAPTPLGFLALQATKGRAAAWLVQELVALRGLSPDARCRAEGRYYGRELPGDNCQGTVPWQIRTISIRPS